MPIAYHPRFSVALALLAALFMSGCKDADDKRAQDLPGAPASAKFDATDSVVGTPPAGPTREAPATTSAARSDISKAEQSEAMPLPGQANDDSALSPQDAKKVKAEQRP